MQAFSEVEKRAILRRPEEIAEVVKQSQDLHSGGPPAEIRSSLKSALIAAGAEPGDAELDAIAEGIATGKMKKISTRMHAESKLTNTEDPGFQGSHR
jgi:hypothetical protein